MIGNTAPYHRLKDLKYAMDKRVKIYVECACWLILVRVPLRVKRAARASQQIALSHRINMKEALALINQFQNILAVVSVAPAV